MENMRSVHNMKWNRYPEDVIPMWIAAPDVPIAPEIKDSLIQSVKEQNLFYNSDSSASEAMMKKVNEVNKIPAKRSDIKIIQGVNPSIWLGVKTACREGDEVILNDPMYGVFNRVMNVVNTKPISWPLEEEEGYKFDEERLKELISDRTKLIFLCNPHNPSGRVMTKTELKAVADIALDNKITIMVDELWEDIIFDNLKHTSIASLSPDVSDITISSWGFSKTFGVAGLQLGYMCVTNKDMMSQINKHSSAIQNGSSTLAKAAAKVMLSKEMDYWREGIRTHLHKVRDICSKSLNSISGVKFPNLEGTYVPFPKFDVGMDSQQLQKYLLEEAKVAISSGHSYGPRGEGHLRVNIATSEVIMNEAMDRVEKALRKL